MADYAQTTWVENVTKVGPTRLNALEAGVKDAAEHNKRGLLSARPAADATSKGWLYEAYDVGVLYRSTGVAWTRAAADGALGQVTDFAGVTDTIPAGWLVADGSAVSRATYSDLFAAMRGLQFNGTTVSGSANMTGVALATPVAVGQYLEGPGVPAGAYVIGFGVPGATKTVIMSAPATSSGTTPDMYASWQGFGNGTTTFNLPKGYTPRARIYRNAAYNQPNSWNRVPFDTVETDNDSMFDSTNNRLICRSAGSWKLAAGAMLGNSSGGTQRHMVIMVNSKIKAMQTFAFSTNFQTRMNVSTEVDLKLGDIVEAYIYQDTGGALALGITDWVIASGDATPMNWLAAERAGGNGNGGPPALVKVY